MKKLTKQQKLRAREILAQADTQDLLWISDAACAEFDKREVDKRTYVKFAIQHTIKPCDVFDKKEVNKCIDAKFAIQRTKPKPLK